MTDTLVTPRFSLPLLATAQAQKELTHNEALLLIDALLHGTVEGGPVSDPPPAPAAGQCWLVGASPTGEWAGQAAAIALWTEGGWRFVMPRAGMFAVRAADGVRMRFDGETWLTPATIASPSGGVTIDSEARAAVAALVALLDGHGLLISG